MRRLGRILSSRAAAAAARTQLSVIICYTSDVYCLSIAKTAPVEPAQGDVTAPAPMPMHFGYCSTGAKMSRSPEITWSAFLNVRSMTEQKG